MPATTIETGAQMLRMTLHPHQMALGAMRAISEFGLRVAIPLAVGFLMIYPNTVSTCLQLAAIFLVTMIFSNIIIRTS